MRERNGLMSFFADRALGTKVGAGFALVLLILATSSRRVQVMPAGASPAWRAR